MIMVLLVLVIGVTACGKKKDGVDASDSGSSAEEKEYVAIILERDIEVEKKNENETYEFTIGDKQYTAQYLRSSVNAAKKVKDLYRYNSRKETGEEGGEITVMVEREEQERFCRMMIAKPEYFGIDIKNVSNTEEALLEVKEFAKQYIDIDDYELYDYSYDAEYNWEFNRYVDGVESEERFKIQYYKGPEILCISAEYIDKYKGASLSGMDVKKAEEIAFNKAKEVHGDDRVYYASRTYVCTIDGQIGVVFACATEDGGGNEVVFVYLE